MPKQVNITPRRERIAEVTREDLSLAARELLIEGGGSDAVTVRAVAARAGMTAPAIYRYFTNRDALLARVMSDVVAELGRHISQVATDASPGPRERFVQVCRAFRQWALDHRVEFGLLFGAPQRDIEVSAELADGQTFDQVWARLLADIARTCRPRPLPVEAGPDEHEWARTLGVEAGTEVDVTLAMRFVYAWQELYGSICAEVFGHLHWALEDGGVLFEARLIQVADDLGLSDDDPGPQAAALTADQEGTSRDPQGGHRQAQGRAGLPPRPRAPG